MTCGNWESATDEYRQISSRETQVCVLHYVLGDICRDRREVGSVPAEMVVRCGEFMSITLGRLRWSGTYSKLGISYPFQTSNPNPETMGAMAPLTLLLVQISWNDGSDLLTSLVKRQRQEITCSRCMIT